MWRPAFEPQVAFAKGTLALCTIGAAAGLCAMPWLLPPYPLIILSYALVLAIAAFGVNLLLGYTGLLSLGHAAFFGVGAYTGGFIFSFFALNSLELYLLSGVVTATALATAIGFLCVRATRIHFTILTLALAQTVYSFFISGAVFRLAGGEGWGLFLLGGGGLYIPRFSILGTVFPPETFQVAFYYVILVAFLASGMLAWVIVHSPFGKALQAIRDDEVRAACIGIRVSRYRWGAFILSGITTGLAGGLFGQLDRQVTPDQLHWLFSAKMVVATVLGGLLPGPGRRGAGPGGPTGVRPARHRVVLRADARPPAHRRRPPLPRRAGRRGDPLPHLAARFPLSRAQPAAFTPPGLTTAPTASV